MGKQELDAFFAGIVEARGTAYVKHLAGRRRAHLDVMFRDRGPAESFQEHFGGVGRITRETPRYRRDVTNHVYRVRGQAALSIIERLLLGCFPRSQVLCRPLFSSNVRFCQVLGRHCFF
jgi:hypothetical protein